MATEEPRRSGRSTKGQHTKNFDYEVPQQKRKGKSQSAKPAKPTPPEPTPPVTTEDDEIIRCVCGEYEEEEDIERDMICCDKCSAWQHNDCMGLTFAKGEEPDEYFCEQCKPENHRELLDKMARGEKPWEEAARKRQLLAAQERKPRRRKGGKRGRKPRTTEPKPESTKPPTPARDASQHDLEQQQAIPAASVSNEPPSSQKRKFDEHGKGETSEPGPKPKLQRVSTGPQTSPSDARQSPLQDRKASVASTSPQPETAPAQGALSLARMRAVTALSKLFVDQVARAQQQGTFTLPPGQTKDSYGERLGFAVEDAMYRRLCGGSGEPNEAYRNQLRTIMFNVKENPSLRDSLLVGSTTPDALATMSSQDMASEELRRKEEAIKREAERQHILVQETGPRIRRTHKGEEIVEPDTHLVQTDSVFSTVPVRRDTMAEPHPQASLSPRRKSPPVADRSEFNDYTKGSSDKPQRPHIDTQAARDGDKRRASSANFDIQNVWSSVQSPGSGTHHDQMFGQYPGQPPVAPAEHKVQADAEIDQLLRDDDVESPPYSPKDFQADGSVWHGRVAMNSLTEFPASARYVGGADLSGRIPWPQLIPPKIQVDGRIDIQLATNYLCGLRYSQSTDITVIAIPPPDSADDVVHFNRLFDYFVQRNRYGVVGKHPHPSVKDTYIVPVEAGARKKPEFIELLENNSLEEPTPERLLLVVFVVKTGISSSTPSTQQPTPRDQHQHSTSSSASPGTTPLGSVPPQQQQSSSPAVTGPQAPSAAPTTQNGPHPDPQEPKSPPYVPPPPQPYQPPATQEQTGPAAAAQYLGSFVSAPAIQQLLQQVPHATADQFKLIAGILAQHPDAANDYQALMNAIMQAQNGSQAS
ncbi:hypothetical protein VTO42DRAFT_8147 [Malbranchea cinnamomea]